MDQALPDGAEETELTFESLGLSPAVVKAVTDCGYTTPTPIQREVIPRALAGRDVLGCAQTGTGKTASFTLPMIDLLSAGRARARMPRSLIVTPTRELAAQVAENFEKYGKYQKLTFALLIGGVAFGDQQRKLDRGVDVLIATPGRLLDHFERGGVMLTAVKYLVIDEADRMLDMGFVPDIESIVAKLPKMRQTMMFSATMPKEIRRLADTFLSNPQEITVDPPSSTAETISQFLLPYEGNDRDKRASLRALLEAEDVKNALIFCNRKTEVSALHRSLVRTGFKAGALHGDLAQETRMKTLAAFKDGELKYLVASDVAARGLDIPAVSHVLNFDVPINAEDYVHRIGRTGRAGREGRAFTMVGSDDAKSLMAIEKLVGRQIQCVDDESQEIERPEFQEGGSRRRRGGRSGAKRTTESRTTESRSTESRSTESRPSESRGSSERANGENRAKASKSRSGSSRRSNVPAGEKVPAPSTGPKHPAFGDHVPAFILRPVPENLFGSAEPQTGTNG